MSWRLSSKSGNYNPFRNAKFISRHRKTKFILFLKEKKMATSPELKQALKDAADAIARYVQDAATMTVETRYIEMGGDVEKAKLAARTTVKLDGDSESILPMKKSADGELVVDTVVYEMHQENVQAAIDYRAEMLDRLLTVLRGE
jgi:hypothetical protein